MSYLVLKGNKYKSYLVLKELNTRGFVYPVC